MLNKDFLGQGQAYGPTFTTGDVIGKFIFPPKKIKDWFDTYNKKGPSVLIYPCKAVIF